MYLNTEVACDLCIIPCILIVHEIMYISKTNPIPNPGGMNPKKASIAFIKCIGRSSDLLHFRSTFPFLKNSGNE